jgi:hypothetical protein
MSAVFFYSSGPSPTKDVEENQMTQQVAPEGTPAPPAKEGENTVPYSRFKEVNDEKRKLEERIGQIEAEQKIEVEKRLTEQEKYKELADKRGEELVKAQAEADKVAAYEKTLTEVLAAQVEALPKDKRALVPEELSTQGKLNWLAKNAAILKAPAPFDIGAGNRGGGEDHTPPVLTPEEHEYAQKYGMTDEAYAKNR